MSHFYAALGNGADIDSALQIAQQAMLSDGQHAGSEPNASAARRIPTSTYAHPYHWAAFNAFGDYRGLQH